jgi:hypothetical protein
MPGISMMKDVRVLKGKESERTGGDGKVKEG